MWSSNFGPPKKCNPQYAAACLTTGWAFTPEQSFSLSLADIASLTTSSCATVPATTLSDGPDSCWSNASIHLPTPGLAHFSPGQIYSSLKDLVPVCCKPLPSRKYVDPPHIKECRVPSLCTTIPERKRLSVQIFQLRKLARQHWHRTIVREAACGNWVAAATSSSSSLGSSHQAPHWSTWRFLLRQRLRYANTSKTNSLPISSSMLSSVTRHPSPMILVRGGWSSYPKRLWLTNLTSFVPLFVAKSSWKSLPN